MLQVAQMVKPSKGNLRFAAVVHKQACRGSLRDYIYIYSLHNHHQYPFKHFIAVTKSGAQLHLSPIYTATFEKHY